MSKRNQLQAPLIASSIPGLSPNQWEGKSPGIEVALIAARSVSHLELHNITLYFFLDLDKLGSTAGGSGSGSGEGSRTEPNTSDASSGSGENEPKSKNGKL